MKQFFPRNFDDQPITEQNDEIPCSQCGHKYHISQLINLPVRFTSGRTTDKYYCQSCHQRLASMKPIPKERLDLYRRFTIAQNLRKR